MKTAKEALATYFNCDIADMKDCTYQPGRWTIPVYTSDNSYYCCSKTTPAKSSRKGVDEFNWQEIPDNFINQYGWKIYKA